MKHIRHLIIQQKKNDEGGSVETVSSAVITALYNMSKDAQLVYNSTDLKGDLHCAVGSSKQINSLMAQYPGLNIEADTYTVDFEDPEVERICVSNWGSNGAVTLNQLQAVTTTNHAFKGNTTITKFNEFQYFTGLQNPASTTNQLFSGCTNLEEITLSSNLTMMAQNMFLNCTSLENITIPASVQKITNPFIGCTALKAVIATGLTGECAIGRDLDSLTTWQVNSGCTSMTASNCYALTSLTISDTVTTVSLDKCLDYNTEITIPASVTSLRMSNCRMKKVIFEQRDSSITFVTTVSQFSGCSSLQTIENFPSNYSYENPNYTYSGLFSGCSSLTTLIQPPSNCTTIPIYLYRDCTSLQGTIEIPATCTSIGRGAFYYCTSLTAVKIYATTPPSLNGDTTTFQIGYGQALTNGFDILVPNSALATYQANSEWSAYGSRLKGFTE